MMKGIITMRYPSAQSGVKKVFVAEILTLLTAVLTLIGAVLALVGLDGEVTISENAVTWTILGGGALLLVSGIAGFVAMIINLIGLHQGGKDEHGMHYAFIMAVLAIASAAAGEALTMNGKTTIGGLLTDLTGLFNFLVIAFVIASIIRLAELLNDQRMIDKGHRLSAVVLISLLCSLIASTLPGVFHLTLSDQLTGILALVSALAAVLGYILYLGFLKNAVQMLKQ